jgi:hypothetical protein
MGPGGKGWYRSSPCAQPWQPTSATHTRQMPAHCQTMVNTLPPITCAASGGPCPASHQTAAHAPCSSAGTECTLRDQVLAPGETCAGGLMGFPTNGCSITAASWSSLPCCTGHSPWLCAWYTVRQAEGHPTGRPCQGWSRFQQRKSSELRVSVHTPMDMVQCHLPA